MRRRQFLSITAIAGITAVLPVSIQAIDFRATKPDAWTAQTVDEAITVMYGNITPINKGVNLKVPPVASSGKSVPVEITSEIPAKSLSVFQNVNPEATVANFTLHEDSIIDYSIKVKMEKGPAEVTVILEGVDGNFYSSVQSLIVAGGGCDGD